MSRSACLRDLIGSGEVSLGASGRSLVTGKGERSLSFGLPSLDRLLPGGLAPSLHVLEAAGADRGSAAGFVLSVLFSKGSGRLPVLWVVQSLAGAEGGRLHGPGLCGMAFDPGALLVVESGKPAEVLWAVEEGLRSRALAAVVGELQEADRHFDLTASRRLALRSERSQVPAFVLTNAGSRNALAGRTRWHVAPASSKDLVSRRLPGAPVWQLDLLKNRDGPCASVKVGFCPWRGEYFDAMEQKVNKESSARTGDDRILEAACPRLGRSAELSS